MKESRKIIFDCSFKAAAEALKEGAEKVKYDIGHPIYHYHPPASWMNDTNGCYYRDGWYHIFHLQDPFSAWGCSGAMLKDGSILDGELHPNRYWAHSRSRDLLNWEYLNPALKPDRDNGEVNPISGDSIIRDDGSVMLVFTAKRRPGESCIQRAAISYDERSWKRIPGSLIEMESADHEINEEWRDPFVWEYEKNYYMLVGAETSDYAQLLIYQAKDCGMMNWSYRGVFLEKKKQEIAFFECPRLCRINDKWVLIFSPYGPVQYYTGIIDWKKLEFMPEKNGSLDCGNQAYASVIIKNTTPPVLYSWIPGWNKEVYSKDWNGCLSVPRELSIDRSGRLIQTPHESVKEFRENMISISKTVITAGHSFELFGERMNHLEIKVSFSWTRNTVARLQLSEFVSLEIRGEKVVFGSMETEVSQMFTEMHLFVDGCIWEIFLEGEAVCMTRAVVPATEKVHGIFSAEQGVVKLDGGSVWDMKGAKFISHYKLE